MAGVGAAAAVAAAPSAGLPASYAAVQSTLRSQFFGDLVELRGALVNTLNLEPQRASNLHLKLQLIDAALRMLEETKSEVTSADMASLMNMSAKVVRAVEAWRARRLSGRQGDAAAEAPRPPQQHTVQLQPASQQQLQPASQQQSMSHQHEQQQQQSTSQQQHQHQQQSTSQQQQQQPQQSASQQQQQSTSQQQQQQRSAEEQAQLPQVVAVCVDADGDMRSRIASPFAAPEVQQAAHDPPRDAATPALPPSPPLTGAADAAAAAVGGGDDRTGTPLSSVDQFDFLSKLIVDPVDPLSAPAASLLPDIDWEVPDVKPSGNLDTLLPFEASQVLLAQQRMVEQKRAAARAQRMSSAEAFLARVSANAAAEGSFGSEAPGASGTLVGPARKQELAPLQPYQQQRSQPVGMPRGPPQCLPSQPPAKQQKQHYLQQASHHEVRHDQLAAAAAAHGLHCLLASPKSAATHSPVGGSHQEVSTNSGGGSRLSGAPGCATAVGSAGHGANGSTEPSPSGSYHQLPTSQGQQPCPHAVRPRGNHDVAGLEPSPFSSAAAQRAVAQPPGQGARGTRVNAAAFGSTQLVHPDSGFAAMQQHPSGFAALQQHPSGFAAMQQQQQQQPQQQQQQQRWLGGSSRPPSAAAPPPPPLGTTTSGASLGFGGGNPHSLQLSASSGRPSQMHTSNPSLVGELQLLGLSSGGVQLGSQALPPHLQTMASYTRQTAAAAQLAAADQQQAERLSALRLLQQFPHAALHGGCGALQQLLSAGDSFGAPGGFNAGAAGQLQHVAAMQAQQQAAQLALERYRRDQLQYQQLQQQLMQPFGGFPQLQAQTPVYQQVQLASGGGTGPAGSGGVPALSAGAGGFPGLPGHSARAGMPGLTVPAEVQSFRICPSVGTGGGSSGAGGMWQAPNVVLAADPHTGYMPQVQSGGQHASHGTYSAGAAFGESASLASGGSSRHKRRRA